MRGLGSLPIVLAALVGATSACAGGRSGEPASPVRLNIARSALPGPGLCRVWVGSLAVSQQPLPRACGGIEHAAPLDSRVLFRPDDRSRTVHVRYMSTSTPGEVIGIDVFNIDTGRLVRVLQRYGDPAR